MYPGETIRLGEKEYVLGKYLSSGLIGTVFPAWEKSKITLPETIPSKENNGLPDKAIKVPSARLDESLSRRFWSELEVLEKVNQEWEKQFSHLPSPFPQTEKGTAGNQELLVMEFVPEEWLLSKVLDEKKGLEREKLALDAARQYAAMLQVLHAANYICLDRKMFDIFFNSEHSRLIVLDWNVVEEYDREKAREEHAIFAAILYGFLTGKVPPADFNPLDDEIWGEVSLGTRRLFADLSLGRYTEKDQKLVGDINNWQAQLQRSASDLLKKAPTKEQIQQEAQEQPVGNLYWQGLALRDLARKVAADEQERADCEKQFKDFREFFGERFDRHFFEAQMALTNEKYEEGLTYLERLKQIVQDDPKLALQRERWCVALSAGKEAKAQNYKFFQVSLKLGNWLKSIPDSANDWQNGFDDVRGLAEFDEHPLLKRFETEIQIRKTWAEFEQKVSETRSGAVSSQHYREMSEFLSKVEENLKGLPDDYASALRVALFPDLDVQKRRAEQRANVEGEFYTLEQSAQKAFLDAPSRYLQYRLVDLQKISNPKQLRELRETLRFLMIVADFAQQSDKPLVDSLLASKVESLTKDLITQPEGEIRQALQTQLQTLIKQTEGDVHQALQTQVKTLIEQTEGDVHQALQTQVKALVEQPNGDVYQALQKQVETLIEQTDNSVHHALQTQVKTLIEQTEGNVYNALQTQVERLIGQTDGSVHQALQNQVIRLIKQPEGPVAHAVQEKVNQEQEKVNQEVVQQTEKTKKRVTLLAWFSTISSIMLSILLLVGFVFLWQRSPSPAPLPTQATAQTITNTPEIAPPTEQVEQPTDTPVIASSLQFRSEKTSFDFDEPIRIQVQYTNLDWEQVEIALLKANGEPFSPEQIGLEKYEQEVTLPSEHFVGRFTLSARLGDKEFSSLVIEVQPPQIDPTELLSVQPDININGKYILLPEESKLTLNDAGKGWLLQAQLSPEEFNQEGNTISLTEKYDRKLVSLSFQIVLNGVYDENGNEYIYKGTLPLSAQQPVDKITGPLYAYDILANAFPDNISPDAKNNKTQLLDNVSVFKDDDIFWLDGQTVIVKDKAYKLVMVIGKINPTTIADLANKASGWYKFPPKAEIKDASDQAVRTLKSGGVASMKLGIENADFFFVKKLDTSLQIILFGVIEQ